MPSFGKKSRSRLDTCDMRLQVLMDKVVTIVDCTVLEGHRTEDKQTKYYSSDPQRSKVQWPNSKHNKSPSRAVDIAPWPIPEGWDKRNFDHLAGVVRAVAHIMGVRIRWGGDWNSDWNLNDQSFNDLVHFELMED